MSEGDRIWDEHVEAERKRAAQDARDGQLTEAVLSAWRSFGPPVVPPDESNAWVQALAFTIGQSVLDLVRRKRGMLDE